MTRRSMFKIVAGAVAGFLVDQSTIAGAMDQARVRCVSIYNINGTRLMGHFFPEAAIFVSETGIKALNPDGKFEDL